MIIIKEHAKITDNISCYNIYNTTEREYIQELIPKNELDDFKIMLKIADKKAITLDFKKLKRSEYNNFYKKIQ